MWFLSLPCTPLSSSPNSQRRSLRPITNHSRTNVIRLLRLAFVWPRSKQQSIDRTWPASLDLPRACSAHLRGAAPQNNLNLGEPKWPHNHSLTFASSTRDRKPSQKHQMLSALTICCWSGLRAKLGSVPSFPWKSVQGKASSDFPCHITMPFSTVVKWRPFYVGQRFAPLSLPYSLCWSLDKPSTATYSHLRPLPF